MVGLASSRETVEEQPENSEEAKRAKRIIYWLMFVFIALPVAVLVYNLFSD